MKAFFGKLYHTRAGRWILAGALAAVWCLLIRATHLITFLNNDDTNILKTLAGYFTGEPYASHPFINWLLGVFVNRLYRLLPDVRWWPLAHLVGLYLGSVAVTAAVLKTAAHKKLPLVFPLLAASAMMLLFFSYALVTMAFTLTAGVLGAGAFALFLAFGLGEADERRPVGALLPILLLLAGCFLFRNSSGISILPFFALAAAYQLVHAARVPDRAARKRALTIRLPFIAAAALTALALVLTNAWGIERINGADYVAFDTARSGFMDYSHDTYEENPALYEAVGWDETLYDMAEARFFMDPRINADTLRYIAEHSVAANRSVLDKLLDAIKTGVRTARGNGQIKYTLAPMLCLLLVGAVGFVRRRERWPEFAALLFCALGGFLLAFYLCYAGRFLLRTYLLLAYPTAAGFLILTLLLIDGKCALRADRSRTYREFNLALTLIFAAALLLSGVKTLAALDASDDAADTLHASRQLKQYAIEHSHNVYIRAVNVGNDIDPYMIYPDKKPINLLDWGGTGMYTGVMKAQIRANGLDAFTPDVFRRDNVYFVSTVENHLSRHFLDYMKRYYGATDLVEVDRVTSFIVVYRVEFS